MHSTEPRRKAGEQAHVDVSFGGESGRLHGELKRLVDNPRSAEQVSRQTQIEMLKQGAPVEQVDL